jgi:DNA-binding response OmpR family regulator
MKKILIIEDDPAIRTGLKETFTTEGYNVSDADTGTKGFELASKQNYDLIVLDLILPGKDGIEICKDLRSDGVKTPIVMVTSRKEEIDKILGLEIGADDYVTKPFSPRELIARVNALIRRTKQTQQAKELYHFGDMDIDFKKYEVKKGAESVNLTALEFTLLHFLIKHEDQVVSRDSILDNVWGNSVYVYPRTIDTHIANLRKKIEDDPENPKFILGVRSIGYKFKADQT